MKGQCSTCPFKPGSEYAALSPYLAQSALSEASRICHSTGRNAIKQTNKKNMLCRGARDVQLKFFCSTGFLSEPTDAAWEAKCKELGIP